MLEIAAFTLGPVQTNSYLIADTETKTAAVIDPAWDGHLIAAEAARRGWQIAHVWLTHAHFDHLGGVAAVVSGTTPHPPVALHPKDYGLWQQQGGAPLFGLHIEPGPEPSLNLEHGAKLHLGALAFEVRYAPGHTPGHVMFYCPAHNLLFCGDVVFQGSIGRTDLPGGDYDTLMSSIQTQVLTLPDETRLLSGHGPETTVGVERKHNPFFGVS